MLCGQALLMYVCEIIFILITLFMRAEVMDPGLEAWCISLTLDFSQVKAKWYYLQYNSESFRILRKNKNLTKNHRV